MKWFSWAKVQLFAKNSKSHSHRISLSNTDKTSERMGRGRERAAEEEWKSKTIIERKPVGWRCVITQFQSLHSLFWLFSFANGGVVFSLCLLGLVWKWLWQTIQTNFSKFVQSENSHYVVASTHFAASNLEMHLQLINGIVIWIKCSGWCDFCRWIFWLMNIAMRYREKVSSLSRNTISSWFGELKLSQFWFVDSETSRTEASKQICRINRTRLQSNPAQFSLPFQQFKSTSNSPNTRTHTHIHRPLQIYNAT